MAATTYTYDTYGKPTITGSLGNEFDFAGDLARKCLARRNTRVPDDGNQYVYCAGLSQVPSPAPSACSPDSS